MILAVAPAAALIVLDGILGLAILWRVLYHAYIGSHWRRTLLHLVLLCACCFRSVFWIGFLNEDVFSIGLGLLLLSWACIYCCVAEIIFQWSMAVSAGLVSSRQLYPACKTYELKATIVFNIVHAAALACSPFVLPQRLSMHSTLVYIDTHLILFGTLLVVHLVTAVINMVATTMIGIKLLVRVSASTIEHKDRSRNMTILFTVFIVFSLLVEVTLQFPIALHGLSSAWESQSAFVMAIPIVFFPAFLVSLTFLYLMRRLLPKKPACLVTSPVRGNVEFHTTPVLQAQYVPSRKAIDIILHENTTNVQYFSSSDDDATWV
ncbi:hypothetical protein THRCLA_03896 [Thraustotheca clavata]|uniref:THH1/TOM1/TOM3 domain-containing protein n=1 Tax=Thraustotheca clavata TaxID=74557 RepID=A0A1W0A0S8_9STRA|nr:hypothetical protein THRCLA_03896 [Thraustotheca clavata]